MINFIKHFLQRAKLKIVHESNDRISQNILNAYNQIRLSPFKSAFAIQKLSALAYQVNLKALLEQHSITCVIDIGANTGQFGSLLRELGFKGQIISFEPCAKARSQLLQKATKESNWKVMPFALGNTTAKKKINIFLDDTFSSIRNINKVGNENFGNFLNIKKQEIIKIHKLDNIIQSLFQKSVPKRLMLKTDTQGYDLEVLKGSYNILKKIHIVSTEAAAETIYNRSPTYPKIFAFLKSSGFKPSGFYPSAHRKDSFSMIEFEALFTRY